jgi:hypothetical protein
MEMPFRLHHWMAMKQLLVEKGEDVNAQGGYYGNALQANHWVVIKKLWACCWRRG